MIGAQAASAHQPLFLGPEHDTPENGPRIMDGTVSFAVYTTLDAPGETRGLRTTFVSGSPLLVELLIPDLEPERTVGVAELPIVSVIAPDGTSTDIESMIGAAFDEPFTGTRYIRIARYESVAIDGTYGVMVSARSAARVTIVVGRDERPGEIDGTGAQGSVQEWWASPPAVVPPSVTSLTTAPAPAAIPTSAPTLVALGAPTTATATVTVLSVVPATAVSAPASTIASQAGADDGLPPRWVLVVVPMVAVLAFGLIARSRRR